MNESIFTPEEQVGHHDCEGLAIALANYFSKEDLIWDVGCSVGYYVKYLMLNYRHKICGIEGTPYIWDIALTKNIIGFDLSKNLPRILPVGSVMCIEVAEHIQKEYESIFLENINLLCKRQLVLSWAIKGQTGLRHVNEQNEDYVIPTIEKLGFKYLDAPSQHFREEAGKEFSYFSNTIYAFERS